MNHIKNFIKYGVIPGLVTAAGIIIYGEHQYEKKLKLKKAYPESCPCEQCNPCGRCDEAFEQWQKECDKNNVTNGFVRLAMFDCMHDTLKMNLEKKLKEQK